MPAHDERDFEFAKVMDLPVIHVVEDPKADVDDEGEKGCFTSKGTLVNSGDFSGMKSDEAVNAITEKLSSIEMGSLTTNYKLRDWVFSRQRYWGEPIPIYFPIKFTSDGEDLNPTDHDFEIDYNNPIPVDESDLPLCLPEMDNFEPSGDTPEGILSRADPSWRFFQKDGKWFSRETNTMPQWAGSCWYYFRYLDPSNSEKAFDEKLDEQWMPVDLYVGGAEHAVLHLLYARFWHKVLYDAGFTKHSEPFQKLVHQGMILGSDGEKMSKSRGNVVNPDDIVTSAGADALRLYEMFMGPLEAVKPWQTEQVTGVVRFINKLYRVVKSAVESSNDLEMDKETAKIMNKTIQKVTKDIEEMSFNTAISALMVYTNHLSSLKECPSEAAKVLALLISPFAPHLGEECWSMLGSEESLAYYPWPSYDEKYLVDDTVKMGVQINGKTRGEVELNKEATQEDAIEEAMKIDKVSNFLDGKDIKKVIFVPGRILNIVAK